MTTPNTVAALMALVDDYAAAVHAFRRDLSNPHQVEHDQYVLRATRAAVEASARALAAIPEQQAGGVPAGWQPIRTAPVFGESVLLWWRRAGAMRGRFVNGEVGDGWVCDGDQVMPLNQEDGTHWMPLPADPDAAPTPPAVHPLSEAQIEAAAEKLAERMDYPWTYMTDEGRAALREAAKAVIEAGIVTPKEPTP